MTIETGDSRFKLVGAGQMSPAQCVVTGQVSDLIDLGRNIQGYGRLYLSVDAIRELAAVAGVLEKQDANIQQVEWYTHGYSDAVKKDFDGTLRILLAELGSVADRLERVDAPVLAEGAGEAATESGSEPADSGLDILGPDVEPEPDARASEPAGSGKGSRGVRRTRLDDAFAS